MDNFTQLYMRMAERAVKRGEYPMTLGEFAETQEYREEESKRYFCIGVHTALIFSKWKRIGKNIRINAENFYYKEDLWADPFKKFVFDSLKKNKEKK
jgi:predicted DNA-binding WGR domain protein